MIKMATYEETMEALEGAIKKWEKIYAGVGVDEGVDNCPLCELFDDDDCTGCPECAKCTEIALNMINYLKSLRPKVDEMFYK